MCIRTFRLAGIVLLVLSSTFAAARIGHAQVQQPAETDMESQGDSLAVSGSGFATKALRTGETAFQNRAYIWQSVPHKMEDWQFTETAGGKPARISVQSTKDGFVYVAFDSTTPELAAGVPGWTLQRDLTLKLNDKKHTVYCVFRAECRANVSLDVPQIGWGGGIVLAPKLTETILPVTAKPPGVVIDYIPASSHVFVGSPSIAILPDSSYVASHDRFFAGRDGDTTYLFQSHDRGASWQPLSEVAHQYWSTLFVFRGALYLCGTTHAFGQAVIRRSLDGGRTWTTPRDASTGVLTAQRGISTAPTPVVEYNDRLWRAFEINPPGAHGRQFQPFVMSAAIGSDLLRADSWTHTNALPIDMEETGGNVLEGNAVLAPDGGVAAIYRIGKDGLEKAALLHVAADGRSIAWDAQHDAIDLPGGGVKFTVRFDPVSRLYWSLVDKQRDPKALRNILCLTSSPDLRHWKVEATLLEHPDKAKHAFQYVDWQFDGDDIVAVSRTSWNGDTYHNANYLTFHRVTNFRTTQRAVK